MEEEEAEIEEALLEPTICSSVHEESWDQTPPSSEQEEEWNLTLPSIGMLPPLRLTSIGRQVSVTSLGRQGSVFNFVPSGETVVPTAEPASVVTIDNFEIIALPPFEESFSGKKRRAESDVESSADSDEAEDDKSDEPLAPTPQLMATPRPVPPASVPATSAEPALGRPRMKLSLVQRNRQALSSVETTDFLGTRKTCSVVDYLRRDKGNTSRQRKKASNGSFDHAKIRRLRPRYLNVLVDEWAGKTSLESLKFDVFTSSEDCTLGEPVGRDLEFAIEKGNLLRIDVDCIDPSRFPRSEDRWLALRCRDSVGTLCIVPFLLSWWKAKRHRMSKH